MSRVLDQAFDHPLKIEERASMLCAGGLMSHGCQCGMIWGATLAAGAQTYRLLGPGPQAETEAIIAAQRLVASFRAIYNNINCFEIIESRMKTPMEVLKFFIKGGPIGCLRMASKYSPAAFSEINASLSEKHLEAPSPPVSCAAMVAQKMGASDLHTVMAAGFAGGIGLCGGGCGALGAAIWIIGMKCLDEGAGKIDFKNPKFIDTVDRFLKRTDFKFECSEIVGRKFESVQDHAAYLRDGGCSKIIEVLAAE